jgi:hypothetical protein
MVMSQILFDLRDEGVELAFFDNRPHFVHRAQALLPKQRPPGVADGRATVCSGARSSLADTGQRTVASTS